MSKQFALLASLAICAALLAVPTKSVAQDSTFQVSTSQAWTDTGLDLQTGDEISIAATAAAGGSDSGLPACDPKGVSGSNADLPLPSAAAGALLARLHAHGAAPLLAGASYELKIEEASHLFLGMNMAGSPPCQGALTVTVHRTTAGSSSESQAQTRGAQLKSQLSTAASIFMAGQFGMGKSESGSSGSGGEALKVSDAPLDADLRKGIDSLPRRVNDQFQNLGDMVNFVIVGNQKDVQAALDAANWHIADTSNEKAVMNAIEETYGSKDYLTMPMSTLFLFGRKQDFGYEMAEPIAMVASRHHFRIWKAPFTWSGKEVWVGAGTHDIGFAKDKRNGLVTHKIDPSVDGERDNIGTSLQKSTKAKTLAYYLPPNPVQDAKNATGDGYHSDGKMLVVILE